MTACAACGVALMTGGCGQVIGVDDYRIDDSDGAGVAAAELPLLPAKPDQDFLASCRACAAQLCDTERRACLESERCTALLRCHGECSDPNCIFRCRDTGPESATFEDYFACVFGPFGGGHYAKPQSLCPDDCNAGANWECAGHYVWDKRQPEETVVEVRVEIMGARAPGSVLDAFSYVEIAACEEVLAGGQVTGDGTCDAYEATDSYGTAFLTLGLRRCRDFPNDTGVLAQRAESRRSSRGAQQDSTSAETARRVRPGDAGRPFERRGLFAIGGSALRFVL